ncbi:hypothetical protein F0562_010755 [Nyssa sinensis]|uniref:Uncharacterized protein n=1 Tax=Nyssa sinensis TaxID=561372 RepID=A0A5J5A3G7_9ASTE|nr:hypothetical protein F0562_010755 [Nyssa sinensis]
MDSMENGTSAAVGSNQNTESGVDSGSGVQVKSVIDRNSVTLGFKSKNYKKIDGDSIPILDFDHNVNDDFCYSDVAGENGGAEPGTEFNQQWRQFWA